jgi:hypothetical protein
MSQPMPHDAPSFARARAGEHAGDLSPAQRDLLGRVIAKRIERGMKLETIARAVANALPEIEPARARQLGRDEALRALGWETLTNLRAQGLAEVMIRPAPDACPHCRAAAGHFAIAAVAELPVAGCTHAAGCRCVYAAPTAAPAPDAAPSSAVSAPGDAGAPERDRPWYRKRPPRPHPPRWTEERREAARRARERSGQAKKPPRRP